MKNTKKTKLGTAPTIASAAARCGMPAELLQHCKALGWQCFKANGRVDCDALLERLGEHQEVLEQFGVNVSEKLEKALWLRAKREREQHALALERGEVWPIDDVKRSNTTFIFAMKARLMQAAHNLGIAATVDLGLTDPEKQRIFREIITNEHTEVLRHLHSGKWFNSPCPNCGKSPLSTEETKEQNEIKTTEAK
jgi:hypothetical protein